MIIKEEDFMKKMRLHIYILLGVFLIGFIVGSFVDLQLSTSIFYRDNAFGLTISAIGTIPGYMILAVLGGGFFALGLHKNYKVAYKVVLYVIAVACVGVAIFFSGREFFGPNGFEDAAPKWIGYLITTPIAGGCGFLGYVLTKKSNTPYLWLIFGIVAFFIFMSLVPGVTLLKAIFHRPRFRTLSTVEAQVAGLEFHNWWQRCSDYKNYMSLLNVTSEEFKSFPSGHAGASAVFVLGISVLPLLDKKYEKLQIPLFYAGFAWVLFVSFTRILVGAHFLSDVSMGAMLTTIFMLINNEVLIALNKKFKFAE